jgi:hypothetical protein
MPFLEILEVHSSGVVVSKIIENSKQEFLPVVS